MVRQERRRRCKRLEEARKLRRYDDYSLKIVHDYLRIWAFLYSAYLLGRRLGIQFGANRGVESGGEVFWRECMAKNGGERT